METLWGADARPAESRPTVVTVGMFDGIHRGHALLFSKVTEQARALDARAAIVTFEPHPLEVIAPDRAPCVLTTISQRLALFEEHGFDLVLVLRFDEELASHSPEEFVRATLVEELRVRRVIVGTDFRFGHNRAGDVNTLTELGTKFGFEAEAIGLLGDGQDAPSGAPSQDAPSGAPSQDAPSGAPSQDAPSGAPSDGKISSSEIRRLIGEGKVAEAAELLGRSYRLAGTVIRGDERGRTLGFPTANLGPHPRACLPGRGVYAGWWVWDGRRLPGVINVGVRPTFGASVSPLCEIHIFGFEGDLYEAEGEVEFTAFLRPERRFEGVEALMAQISEDAERARVLLSA